jgi:lipoprotein NlpI
MVVYAPGNLSSIRRTFLVPTLALVLALSTVLADDAEVEIAGILAEAKSVDAAKAVEVLSAGIEKHPAVGELYYWRGRENFRTGQVKESLADFDKFVELKPALASQQWERGISAYYAGKFREGAKQFELYQTYHDQDVENSVWRYLCVAATEGAEKARANMLPIKNDPRVPMMQVYGLYRGESTVDDVLKASEKPNQNPAVLRSQRFYANLYVGLYLESLGKRGEARPYIEKAATDFRIEHYMGDVARVHWERIKDK